MHAFPKSARLRSGPEFRVALEKGVKSVSSQVVLFARPRASATESALAGAGSRLGLIVSRKVGEAVVRTRVKRHLREAFRHLKPELDQTAELKEMDLVVIARANAAAASSAEIADALKFCLKRIKQQLSRHAEGSEAPKAPPA